MTDRRVAIVTGSSRGIGRGIALELGSNGCAVVVNYVQNQAAAQETAGTIRAAGGEAILVQANIAHSTDRQLLVDQAMDQLGRIDLLVNNAGVPVEQRVDLLDATEQSWDRILGTNLKGPYFLSQLVARHMINQVRAGAVARPKIINISSVSAYASSTNRGDYCVAKAGMTMMTQLFADRLAEYGIQVFEIRPGIVETDMTLPVRAKYDRLIADGMNPIRRWGQPADVAKAVTAIVQDYFPYSTGEIINVDGGYHLRRL
jgi:NAD(P)-dependent dehydrogenase (short-subunit alcohol dehydrogenase family)